jgi:hypothetical protein
MELDQEHVELADFYAITRFPDGVTPHIHDEVAKALAEARQQLAERGPEPIQESGPIGEPNLYIVHDGEWWKCVVGGRVVSYCREQEAAEKWLAHFRQLPRIEQIGSK